MFFDTGSTMTIEHDHDRLNGECKLKAFLWANGKP